MAELFTSCPALPEGRVLLPVKHSFKIACCCCVSIAFAVKALRINFTLKKKELHA